MLQFFVAKMLRLKRIIAKTCLVHTQIDEYYSKLKGEQMCLCCKACDNIVREQIACL